MQATLVARWSRRTVSGARQDGRRGIRSARDVLPGHGHVVPGGLRAPHGRPGGSLAGGRRRGERTRRRADRVGQDAGRVPVGAGRPDPLPRPVGQGALPGALRVALEGAGGRRRAQPPGTAGRDHADGAPAGPGTTQCHRRRSLRRHLGGRPASAGHPAAGHPDHHPGVAVPDADLRRAGPAAVGSHGDRRRGPRPGRHQARRSSGPIARAAGGIDGRVAAARRRRGAAATAADRPLGHGAARGTGGGLPRRFLSGPGGGSAGREGLGPVDRGPGRGHERPCGQRIHPDGAAQPGRRSTAAAHAVDLAARGEPDPRRHQRAPVDHRVRQLPATGRAADRSSQRAAGRAAGRGDRRVSATRGDHGSVRCLDRPGRQRRRR